jgi:hypothetical protein
MNGNPASFKREPLWWIASVQGIVQAIFILLNSFNVPITGAQQAAITGVILVVCTAWGRSQVYSPVNSQGQPIAAVGPNEYAEILNTPPPVQTAGAPQKTPEQLLADYKARMRQPQPEPVP